MCGIVGYFGKSACEKLKEKIKKLEYRGYDSAGIAFKNASSIYVHKGVGYVSEVFKNFELSDGEIGIAHTRWATHGKVSKENAHPHLSMNEKVAIVHNGIVENYEILKKFLELNDFEFRSETDSEVIANLIEFELKKTSNPFFAYINAIKMVEGQHAIISIFKDYDCMIASKNECPLVLGFSKGSFILASDLICLNDCKKFLILEDGDVAYLDKNKFFIFNFKKNSIVKPVFQVYKKNEWESKLEGFPHYMIKEILEQPKIVEKIVKGNVASFKNLLKDIEFCERVWIFGCGSAYNSSLIFSSLLRECGIDSIAIASSEIKEYEKILGDDLAIAISQSGETADTLSACKIFKSNNIKVYSIVNVPHSTLARISDFQIFNNCGPEICVVATKSFLSQVAIAKHFYNMINSLNSDLKQLKNLVSKTIKENKNKALKLANILKNKRSIFVISKGLDKGIGKEAALKIKEVSYIHAESFEAGELKHGSIALIEKDFPCIFFLRNDKDLVSNLKEVESRGGFIITIGNYEKDFSFNLDESDWEIVYKIVPIQLLSYYLALEKELNPDRPRNLAKSVTVK